MSTTTLYPNGQTYSTVVAAVQANSTSVLWIINNRVGIQWQPSVAVGSKVSVCSPAVASTFNGLVVKGGNSGLASAVNGSFGFTWNPQISGQDDAAQAAILSPTSAVFASPTYQF